MDPQLGEWALLVFASTRTELARAAPEAVNHFPVNRGNDLVLHSAGREFCFSGSGAARAFCTLVPTSLPEPDPEPPADSLAVGWEIGEPWC